MNRQYKYADIPDCNSIIGIALSGYDIGSYIAFEKNKTGRDIHYALMTTTNKYFIKVLNKKNENINMDDEIAVCNFLKKRQLSAIPTYICRKDGNYLTQINEHIFINVQEFIEGNIWNKYQAPDWLLFTGASYIADVHNNLNDIKLKRRPAIMRINDANGSLIQLMEIEKKILKCPQSKNRDFILDDLSLRKTILRNQKPIDICNLTFVNGHSDYTIKQIITRNKSFVGVVDFSEVAYIPAIWELMRFYINSAPECIRQKIDKNKFEIYITNYMKKSRITDYDKEVFVDFNLYYFVQALSVYEKYLEEQSERYMMRIISRNAAIKCLQYMKQTDLRVHCK